jgi:RNA polymerase sigma-70 factor (ECF subfamily)
VTLEGRDILQTTALSIEAGRVAAVYIVRNPEKLAHVRRRFAGAEASGP